MAQTSPAWAQLQPASPSPIARYGSASAYNSTTNRFIDFGGFANDARFHNDLWVLTDANGVGFTSWNKAMADDVAGSPPRRYAASAAYDSANNRMILYGGQAEYITTFFDDVWLLRNADGSAATPIWTQLAPAGTPPLARRGHGAAFDPASKRMIVFGGEQGGQSCPCTLLNDVWVLTNANGGDSTTPTWIRLTPTGGPPPPRTQFVTAYDANTNRLIVYGGYSYASGYLYDTWVLTNANGTGGTPVWQQLGTGPAPNEESDGTGAFDSATNELIVFDPLSHVWVLQNANGFGTSAWRQLTPSGSAPPARFGIAGGYDPVHNKLIVYGGQIRGGLPLNDVWVLAGANGAGPATQPAAALSASALVFSAQAIGTTSPSQTVTLTNTGLAALNIGAIVITGGNNTDFLQTNTCGASLASNTSCTISITFTPSALGSRSAAITISDNAAGGFQTVTLSGTGIPSAAPAVTLSPTSLVFPGQPVGMSAAQSISLKNTGTAVLNLAISITGVNNGDFAEADNCGSSLIAGAQCTLTVTFIPTAAVTRTASITIADNAANSPQIVSLSGVGASVPQSAPAIFSGGIVNAGGFGAPPVAAGSIVAIYGANMAAPNPGKGVSASTLPLPTNLGGAQVYMNGVSAPLFYADSGQINAQVPWELSGGSSTSVQVVYNGANSNSLVVPLAQAAPGVFVVVHSSDYSPITASKPAVPGEYLIVFCTGLGPVTNQPPTGGAAPSNPPAATITSPAVTIGGASVATVFSGLTPSLVGVYQINFQLPGNSPVGNSVALKITNATYSAISTIAVSGPVLSISSVSNNAPIPFTPLYIKMTGLVSTDPSTINVAFANSAGFSVTEKAVSVGSDGTVAVGAPLYIDPGSKQITQGVVSVRVTQGSQTTQAAPLTIQSLPPLSTYGTRLGQISHAFLTFESMLHAKRINELQAIQSGLNSTDTSALRQTLQSIEQATLLAETDIDGVSSSSNNVISWGSLRDGTPLQFDQTQLDIMDRIIGAYLIQQFGTSSLVQSSRRTGGTPFASRVDIPTAIQEIVGLMTTHDGSEELASNQRAAAAEQYLAPLETMSSSLQTWKLPLPAGIVGLVSGYGHLIVAANSWSSDLSPIAACLATAGSCDPTQAYNNYVNDTYKTVRAIASTVAQVPVALGQPTEAVEQASNLLNSLVTVANNASQLQAGDATDLAVASKFGLWPAIGVVSGSTGATQSSLNLCCIGAANLGITGLSDPNGNYDFYVPVNVPGTNYGNLTLTAKTAIAGTTLGSETVDLRGLNTSTPIAIPAVPLTTPSNSDFSGDWIGNYSYFGGNCNWQSAGQMRLTLQSNQSGSYTVSATLANVQFRDLSTCAVLSYQTLSATGSGALSGSTLTFTLGLGNDTYHFTANIAANTMAGTVHDDSGESGTFNLIR